MEPSRQLTEPDPAQGQEAELQSCNFCGKTDLLTLFSANDFDTGEEHFTLMTCRQCGLTWTSPLLTGSELGRYYSLEYYGSSSQKFSSLVETWTVWSSNRMAGRIGAFAAIKPGNRHSANVLDIGCGRANLLKALNRTGFNCYGIERETFPDHLENDDIKIIQKDFLDAGFGENFFDVIVIWHVLEHLNQPAQTIKKAAICLKPGGKLIVSVPNFGSLQSRLFGKYWFHLDLPRHLYHFTHSSLQTMLNSHGFHIRKSSTLSLDQGIYGFIQSALNRLFPRTPNLLYRALKKTGARPATKKIILHCIVAVLIFPLAVAEFVFSALSGKGACLTYYCEKSTDSVPKSDTVQ